MIKLNNASTNYEYDPPIRHNPIATGMQDRYDGIPAFLLPSASWRERASRHWRLLSSVSFPFSACQMPQRKAAIHTMFVVLVAQFFADLSHLELDADSVTPQSMWRRL